MTELTIKTPGELLVQEFLEPAGITPYELAMRTGISKSQIYGLCRGERRITAEIALKLGKALGTSAQFWLNMQDDYDLRLSEKNIRGELAKIKPFAPVTPALA